MSERILRFFIQLGSTLTQSSSETFTSKISESSFSAFFRANFIVCAERPITIVDILLDFSTGQETYPNFLNACQILENGFKRYKLDVVTRKGLSPYIGQSILSEVEYV